LSWSWKKTLAVVCSHSSQGHRAIFSPDAAPAYARIPAMASADRPTTSVLLAPTVPSATLPPSTLKYEAGTIHPVQKMISTRTASDVQARRTLQAATYGSAFPMRRMMQESVLGQFHRLPGLPSSGVALDVLSGRDTDIDFEDYLNLPSECPVGPDGLGLDTLSATHDAMEKMLGIAPKAPF
jgi:Proteasome maturation factor UMP1